jgi:hypothetical protein
VHKCFGNKRLLAYFFVGSQSKKIPQMGFFGTDFWRQKNKDGGSFPIPYADVYLWHNICQVAERLMGKAKSNNGRVARVASMRLKLNILPEL